ncbi:MAG TPA: (d)CMP kinase [Bdellovibrionota bacterium]|nr:(d)CMP kinase [Bdellovibrionota bacterium]
MIITIDGPTGVGKSSVSKRLSKKLGILYLESGALYRALAYKSLKQKLSLTEAFIKKMLQNTKIHVQGQKGKISVILDGTCVDAYLRDEKIGNRASEISQMKCVREFLLHVQRDCAKENDLIAEGRDMGTVVFPEAQYKFYLEAKPQIRVQRRFLELEKKRHRVNLDKIKKNLHERDKKDTEREISPLKVPEGAHLIDTSGLSLDEVVQKIVDAINKKRNMDPSAALSG